MHNHFKKTLIAALLLSTITVSAYAAVPVVNPAQSAPLKSATGKHLFGYYTNYSVYSRKYEPAQVPVVDLTAIIYAFAQVGNCAAPFDATAENPSICNASGSAGTATGEQTFKKLYSSDGYADFKVIPEGYKSAGTQGLGTMSKMITLAHAQKKAVLLSIGGYTLTAALTVAMEPKNRPEFIQSIIKFLEAAKKENNQDGFDGVDIDWEPHNWHTLTMQQLNNWVRFLQELKAALKTQYASWSWLTIAVTADPKSIERVGAANWSSIASSLDFINVMAYDYHGSFDQPPITNLQSALAYDPNQPGNVSGRDDFNIESSMAAFKRMGVPANKLILGYPSYGRAMAAVENKAPAAYPKALGLYQPFKGAPVGEFNDGSGIYNYKFIIGKMLGRGYVDYRFENLATSGAYNPAEKIFISYDGIQDVQAKAAYVIRQGYAGLMTWELSGDIDGNAPDYKNASLLHAARMGLGEL